MYQFVLVVHIIAAVCIIALVLVQQGKGATIGSSFGAGASQTIFGSRGAGSFLLRLTLAFVFAFFATSIALNWLSAHAVKQTQTQSSQLPAGLMQPVTPESAATLPTETAPSLPLDTAPATTMPVAIPPLQQSVTPASLPAVSDMQKAVSSPVKKTAKSVKKTSKIKKTGKKHTKKPHTSGQ